MSESNEITYTCDPDNERDVAEFVEAAVGSRRWYGHVRDGRKDVGFYDPVREYGEPVVWVECGDTVKVVDGTLAIERESDLLTRLLGSPRAPTDLHDELVAASREFPYSMLHEAELHPVLQATALWNSRVCAQRRQQYHYDLNRRFGRLMKDMGGGRPNEVCAQSWKRQEAETPRQLWDEMLRCWRQSRGHWAVVCKKHRWIGSAMEKGANGVWYATVTVFDPGVAAAEENSNG